MATRSVSNTCTAAPLSAPATTQQRSIIKIAIIILNWNNAPDTLECLTSIEKIDYPHFEVLLVDNGSTDGSLQRIRAQFPQLTVIENGENLGFAEGSNRGLAEGLKRGADLLLLLNNDTVVSPHLLTELAKAAQDNPHAGAFGPKIYFYDEPATIWYAGGSVDAKTGRCYHVGCGAFEGHNEEVVTDYICGCALAIRPEVLKKVGNLNSDYFLIWEEIDWCYRIRKSGYGCLFVPKAKVWHKISASFPEGNRGPMWQYFYFRNRLLFHHHHSPFNKGLWLRDLIECWDLCRKGFFSESRAALAGICDFLLGRFGKGRLSKYNHSK